jgi:putative transposase
MARPLRIEFPGACYHVINRGNYRRELFLGKGAAEAFERVLGEAAIRYGWRIHAYVVMSNHFHLAVELTEPNLSEGMKWLQGTWIRRYNAYRRIIGRPFQGRYKAILVERGDALGKVCHYIHLNPVRAKLLTAAELNAYVWSSLPKFFVDPRPTWLCADIVLGQAGNLADTPQGWLSYRQYLEFLAEDELSRKALVAENMSQGWCVGSAEFRASMSKEMANKAVALECLDGLESDARQEVRATQWEERLQEIAITAGIDLGQLPKQKSHPSKVRLAAELKQSTSVSNAWLAKRLSMGKPASASQFVRRFVNSRGVSGPEYIQPDNSLESKIETTLAN